MSKRFLAATTIFSTLVSFAFASTINVQRNVTVNEDANVVNLEDKYPLANTYAPFGERSYVWYAKASIGAAKVQSNAITAIGGTVAAYQSEAPAKDGHTTFKSSYTPEVDILLGLASEKCDYHAELGFNYFNTSNNAEIKNDSNTQLLGTAATDLDAVTLELLTKVSSKQNTRRIGGRLHIAKAGLLAKSGLAVNVKSIVIGGKFDADETLEYYATSTDRKILTTTESNYLIGPGALVIASMNPKGNGGWFTSVAGLYALLHTTSDVTQTIKRNNAGTITHLNNTDFKNYRVIYHSGIQSDLGYAFGSGSGPIRVSLGAKFEKYAQLSQTPIVAFANGAGDVVVMSFNFNAAKSF